MRKIWTGTAKRTTVPGTITSGTLSIAATDLSGWPVSGPFVGVLDAGLPTEEWVLCDSRASNTVTVNALGRGYVGTAVAHTNATFRHGPDFNTIDEANRFVNLMTAKGDVVGFDGSLAQRVAATTVDGLVLGSLAAATAGFAWTARSIVPRFATMAARDAALSGGLAPTEGDLCVTQAEDRLWQYTGARWVPIAWYSATGRAGVQVTRAAIQTIANANNADISFTTEVRDFDGWIVAPGTQLVVPAGHDGIYLIQGAAMVDSSPGGGSSLIVRRNGATMFTMAGVNLGSLVVGNGTGLTVAPGPSSQAYTGIVGLVAGDIITLNISNTSGGSRDYTNAIVDIGRMMF